MANVSELITLGLGTPATISYNITVGLGIAAVVAAPAPDTRVAGNVHFGSRVIQYRGINVQYRGSK
jgi:hypothetical protein